ncbi:MAG: hypothetical protein RR413_09460 [Christensenellaceae bacterium]
MDYEKRRILICAEGERTDVKLLEHLLTVFQIDVRYEIIPYCTNIYVLYNAMFADGHPEDMDFLQVLKEHEPCPETKALFDEKYSDILLVFDMDPQDPLFTPESLQQITAYFNESTDMGQLYINYPMVESFYHMSSIPDPCFEGRYATLEELKAKGYKARVNHENRNHDYSKFAVTRNECITVINQNLEKARALSLAATDKILPSPAQEIVLAEQLKILDSHRAVSVLCTCAFFVADYDVKLLNNDDGA